MPSIFPEHEASKLSQHSRSSAAAAQHHVMATKDATLGPIAAGVRHSGPWFASPISAAPWASSPVLYASKTIWS